MFSVEGNGAEKDKSVCAWESCKDERDLIKNEFKGIYSSGNFSRKFVAIS